jgi:NADH:ubiquinone reductase (H+-translocating)
MRNPGKAKLGVRSAMQRVLVLGGGFAGLWAAAGAARKRAELGLGPNTIEIMLVDRSDYHNIRVRNYEPDLSDVVIPLARVLDPIGVRHGRAEVRGIDTTHRAVEVATEGRVEAISYDTLVVALGSALARPPVPGLDEHSFDVDTYLAAEKLREHLKDLGSHPPSLARATVVVAGAGFTGIEVATEMPTRLRGLGVEAPRVILVDGAPVVGATIGDNARPAIVEALAALGIETRLGVRVTAVEECCVTLDSSETIPCATLVWSGGMRASPLAAALTGKPDRLGRIAVDAYMQVEGIARVFAAGDAAWAALDGQHPTVMSCQFARPMGRFAGHNATALLAGTPMLPLKLDCYVTVLDLGPWGALYTVGWDRRLVSTGADAKQVKQEINCRRIYPPRSFAPADTLAAAAPVVQSPPPQVRDTAKAPHA